MPENALEFIRELHALGAIEVVLGEIRVVFPPRPIDPPPARDVAPGRQLTEQETYVLAALSST